MIRLHNLSVNSPGLGKSTLINAVACTERCVTVYGMVLSFLHKTDRGAQDPARKLNYI